MQWRCEPPRWKHTDDIITLTTSAKSDFWRKTHNNLIRDNGHFYYQQIAGSFVAEVTFTGTYQDLYDQAGLMIRADEATWLKCGIEYVSGVQHASVVLTRDYSDWSYVPLLVAPPRIWLRLTWQRPSVEVSYSLNGANFTMLRMGYLADVEHLQVGVMACSPEGSGFEATFEGFVVRTT